MPDAQTQCADDEQAAVEDVLAPSALFVTDANPKSPDGALNLWTLPCGDALTKLKLTKEALRARRDSAPLIKALIDDRRAPSSTWVEPETRRPVPCYLRARRYRITKYRANGSFGHGWEAFDTLKMETVFIKARQMTHRPNTHARTRAHT
jgi:hypothetical protein